VPGSALFEKADRRAGNILDLHVRHNAPQLGERVMFQIEPPRILGRKMRLNAERQVDLPESALVRPGERVAPAFRGVPTGVEERAREDTGGSEHGDGERLASPAPD